MRARIIISLGILLLVSVTAWGKEEKAVPLRCIVTGNVPVDYLSPEQSSFWALCVDIGGKRISDSRFPQSAVVGKDSFSLSDEVMHNSNPTMKLTYMAEDRSSKRLTVFRKGGYHIYPRWDGVTNLDGMGVWVYGNGSGDLLEYIDTWGNVYDPKKITFRKAIIVFTADHGDFAGEHGLHFKNLGIYEPVHRIPLLLRSPGRIAAGTISDLLVESVDLYPTLCDLAGLPVPGRVSGASVMPALEVTAPWTKTASVCEWDQLCALRTDNARLLYSRDGLSNELYDLDKDP